MKSQRIFVLLIGSLIISLANCKLTRSVLPGLASDIGIGTDGSLWITAPDSDNNKIYKWDAVNEAWTWVDNGSGKRLSVGPDGQAWAVGTDNVAYYHNDNRNAWLYLNVAAIDIARGERHEDGWIVGRDGIAYHWTGGFDWMERSPDGVVRIAIDPEGIPWIIKDDGSIRRYLGSGEWEDMILPAGDVTGVDIFISRQGVFLTGSDERVYKWSNEKEEWVKICGVKGVSVAVDTNGNYYALDSKGKITKYTTI